MVYININPVENYLKINPDKILSVRTIAKRLNLKKRATTFFCHNSKFIEKIQDPLIVGSNKFYINCFRYNNLIN